MYITDLVSGEPISLEICMDDSIYVLPSSVICVKNDHIIISPLAYNGKEIDFSNKVLKGLSFNICGIDHISEQRVIWKCVSLETIHYSDGTVDSIYYKIKTNSFSSIASSKERRTTKRVCLNIKGYISIDGTNEKYDITIHDVSDYGMAFIVMNDVPMNDNLYSIDFTDSINEKPFHLYVKCKYVRSVEQGLQTLYGCTISSPSREYLTYVFLKRLCLKVENEKKREAMKAEIIEKQRAALDSAAPENTSSISGFHSHINK